MDMVDTGVRMHLRCFAIFVLLVLTNQVGFAAADEGLPEVISFSKKLEIALTSSAGAYINQLVPSNNVPVLIPLSEGINGFSYDDHDRSEFLPFGRRSGLGDDS
jgi:hypothetical protein